MKNLKNTCLCFIFAFSGAAQAQQINFDDLSDYEKAVHRIAWCDYAANHKPGNTITLLALPGSEERAKQDLGKEIQNIRTVLAKNDFFEKDNDGRYVKLKVKNEIEKKKILDDFELTTEQLERCIEDAKAILKEEYVPWFKYATD